MGDLSKGAIVGIAVAVVVVVAGTVVGILFAVGVIGGCSGTCEPDECKDTGDKICLTDTCGCTKCSSLDPMTITYDPYQKLFLPTGIPTTSEPITFNLQYMAPDGTFATDLDIGAPVVSSNSLGEYTLEATTYNCQFSADAEDTYDCNPGCLDPSVCWQPAGVCQSCRDIGFRIEESSPDTVTWTPWPGVLNYVLISTVNGAEEVDINPSSPYSLTADQRNVFVSFITNGCTVVSNTLRLTNTTPTTGVYGLSADGDTCYVDDVTDIIHCDDLERGEWELSPGRYPGSFRMRSLKTDRWCHVQGIGEVVCNQLLESRGDDFYGRWVGNPTNRFIFTTRGYGCSLVGGVTNVLACEEPNILSTQTLTFTVLV